MCGATLWRVIRKVIELTRRATAEERTSTCEPAVIVLCGPVRDASLWALECRSSRSHLVLLLGRLHLHVPSLRRGDGSQRHRRWRRCSHGLVGGGGGSLRRARTEFGLNATDVDAIVGGGTTCGSTQSGKAGDMCQTAASLLSRLLAVACVSSLSLSVDLSEWSAVRCDRWRRRPTPTRHPPPPHPTRDHS